jgi:hypothetical protein
MALNAIVADPNANSYVTVAEANAYFSDRAYAEEWEKFADQAQVLITSSSLLDWYVRWKGVKAIATASTQAMQWPRDEVYDSENTLIANDIIPVAVKTATMELALSSLGGDRVADDDLLGLLQLDAGSLSMRMQEDSPYKKTSKVIPEKIWKILSGLFTQNTRTVRLMRA